MAKQIVAAVRLKRKVLEGVNMQSDVLDILTAYTRQVMFTRPGPETTRMRNELIRLMRAKYFPIAEESGHKSAVPVLDKIGGEAAVESASPITGTPARVFSAYRTNNTRWFAEEVNAGTSALSSELRAEIARASRDGIAQAQMRTDVINSYKAELKAIKAKRKILRAANIDVANAEATGDLKAIKAAKKEVAKAKAATRRVSTAMGRLENKVQGAARDAVRRETQQAQFASYRQAGYHTFTWVAVGGSLACPDCDALHNDTRSVREWQGQMPGDGHTVCLDSCICELVPDQFIDKEKPITGPVNPYLFQEL